MQNKILHIILFLLAHPHITHGVEINIPDSMLRVRYPLHVANRPPLGFVPASEVPEDWTFDTEAFFERYATLPPSETFSDLDYYYCDYAIHLSPEGKLRELEAMKAAARKYKSQRLEDEVRHLNAFVTHPEKSDENIQRGLETAHRFEKEGKPILAARLKHELFVRSYQTNRYYLSFRIAEELLKDMETLSEEEFPKKKIIYSEIGHLYYQFRDYDRAIPLLEKALTEGKSVWSGMANLRARNTLGIYYHTTGNLEKAAYYNKSILYSESSDNVILRPMYDAIALGNLGRIAAAQGDCLEAERLFRAALPVSLIYSDYNYAVGVLANLGKCYLKMGKTEKAADMIDTMRIYIQDPHVDRWVSPHRDRDLYELISKYYLYKADPASSERFADSLAAANKRYEDEYNARLLLRSRQELHEAEQAVRDEQISSQKRQLAFSAIIILLGFIALLVIVFLYRKKNTAYRALVRKSLEWAASTAMPEKVLMDKQKHPLNSNYVKESNVINEEEQTLLLNTHKLILEKELYRDANLSLNSLAEMIQVNHALLSRVINTTGKNFNQFINEYRIKEAIRIMSDTSRESQRVYLEELFEQVGFNSRSSFNRAFKQNTGLTPREFGKMRGEVITSS